MDISKLTQEEITRLGDPSDPRGVAGEAMLTRMNDSHRLLTDRALSLVSFNGSETVLDIGCGGGAALCKLSRMLPQGKLFGIDHSETAVGLAIRNNAADIERGKMNIQCAQVASMPFEDGMFDVILTVESFYFWKEPQRELKEVYRVLKGGGTFLLALDEYGREGLSDKTLQNAKEYNLFLPTKQQLTDLLHGAGFEETALHTYPGSDMICAKAKK